MNEQWLYKVDELGETPLTRVSKSGRMELANILLIQEVEDSASQIGHMPPMHRAAYWGYGDAISDLLQDGADPTEVNNGGETALHLAVRLGKEEAAVALLNSGMDVNTPNALGMTALHWAALSGHEGLAKILLAYGADAHAREWVCGGLAPLEMARIMGHHELVDLLEHGMEACYT